MDLDLAIAGRLERRKTPRKNLVLAAQIQTALHSRLAVTQDLGRAGAKLLSQDRFNDGEKVALTVLPAGSSGEVHVRGRVLRGAAREAGPWHYSLAVRFDSPLPVESVLLVDAHPPVELSGQD